MSDTTITCGCGAYMVESLCHPHASTFLVCPDCGDIQRVPAAVEVERAGTSMLPGFADVAERPAEGRRYPG